MARSRPVLAHARAWGPTSPHTAVLGDLVPLTSAAPRGHGTPPA
ncbi:MAG TPA: hypothetical protein VNO31_34285 [Umezawaea sp.]|nr:hypothetical protein [Umezawaea sp.]